MLLNYEKISTWICTAAMWASIWTFWPKVLPQSWHLNGLSLLCTILTCLSSIPEKFWFQWRIEKMISIKTYLCLHRRNHTQCTCMACPLNVRFSGESLSEFSVQSLCHIVDSGMAFWFCWREGEESCYVDHQSRSAQFWPTVAWSAYLERECARFAQHNGLYGCAQSLQHQKKPSLLLCAPP